MIFTELRFLPFFVVVWLVHWLLRAERLRKMWLLAASYLFYACTDWRFSFLMLLSTILDWAVGLLLERSEDPARRRILLWFSLFVNLGALAVFKYYDFFVGSFSAALSGFGLVLDPKLLGVAVPVGISFYTFQTLSYTIDVFRGQIAAERSFLDFALFVAFFPQLVAGPIVRASDFLWQLKTRRDLRQVGFRTCVLLFLIGFAKKCVADHVARPVDLVFAAPAGFDSQSLCLGVTLYAVQIYCDFSGYSDMAIALAALFGYRLTENFDSPYVASSVTEFWRRWHISLSTWFRDYLYVPLGGNRRGPIRTYVNLVVVFLLCGLWHGAAWTFVLWGAIHGLALLVERIGARRALAVLPQWIGHVWCLTVVLIGWVFFRSNSVHAAGAFCAGLVRRREAAVPNVVSPAWWGVIATLLVLHILGSRGRLVPSILWRMPPWAFAIVVGVLVGLLLPWIPMGYRPFIYFQF